MVLSTKSLPFSVLHFPSIDSTHLWVISNIQLLISKYGLSPTRPVRVSADRQLQGIGQPRRQSNTNPLNLHSLEENSATQHRASYKPWIGGDGNIAVTFVFPWPQTKMSDVYRLPLVAAGAVALTLMKVGVQPSIKWVNDIVVDGKKIGGILCSATGYEIPYTGMGDNFTAVLVSIGLNVVSVPSLDHLSKSEQQSVTSIADEINQKSNLDTSTLKLVPDLCCPLSTPDILDYLSLEVYRAITQYESRGFSHTWSLLKPLLLEQGCKVRIHHPLISTSNTIEAEKEKKTINKNCREFPMTFVEENHESKKNEVVEGEVLGLSPRSGCLLLKLPNGDIQRFFGGGLQILT